MKSIAKVVPRPFATCPELLAAYERQISALGAQWFGDKCRLCVDEKVQAEWVALLHAWMVDSELPLFVRKHGGRRGSVVSLPSGRIIIPADNSVAQWVFGLAVGGICPAIKEIKKLIDDDKIPIAIAMTKAEEEEAWFKCKLGKYSVNKRGWKLAHVNDLKINVKGPLDQIDECNLKLHFFALLSPANMFVVPLAWAGLAEVASFVGQFRQKIDGA